MTLTESGKVRFEKIEKDMYIEFKKVFSMMNKTDQYKVIEGLRIYNEACRRVEYSDDQRNDKE